MCKIISIYKEAIKVTRKMSFERFLSSLWLNETCFPRELKEFATFCYYIISICDALKISFAYDKSMFDQGIRIKVEN